MFLEPYTSWTDLTRLGVSCKVHLPPPKYRVAGVIRDSLYSRMEDLVP